MELATLERSYRILVACHDAIEAAKDERALLARICAIAVHELGFTLAWIGMLDERGERVVPVAEAGFDAGYLETLDIHATDDARGSGPTGRAVRTREVQVAHDIASDEHYAPWRADALRRGYASSAALPLVDGARCLGTFNLYAPEPDAFGDDAVALLEEMTFDLVLGIERLRARARLEALAVHIDEVSRAETAAVAVGALAHDLNNMLAAVALSVETARRDPVEAIRAAALDDAKQATGLATGLVRQLLALSRRIAPEGGQAQLDPVIAAMRTLLERLAAPVQLEVGLAAGGVVVRITAIELERVLVNLVVNARHATPASGRITIRTELRPHAEPVARAGAEPAAPGVFVAISVEDTGSGIAPELLPRVFEPFFTTKGEQGTGLGLAAVRQIARGAGGDVTVASERGRGARFTVLLPVAAAGVARAAPRSG